MGPKAEAEAVERGEGAGFAGVSLAYPHPQPLSRTGREAVVTNCVGYLCRFFWAAFIIRAMTTIAPMTMITFIVGSLSE